MSIILVAEIKPACNIGIRYMSTEINLRIVLQNPIDGLLYGLQKGKGAAYEVVQPQTGACQDLHFAFVVSMKESAKQQVSLGGPFVQGPAGARFVYINIGSYAGQADAPWSGRMKVPLSEADFNHAESEEGLIWYCSVPGRKADGKPVFATVKPFSGWAWEVHSD